jgi:hypothetical protein
MWLKRYFFIFVLCNVLHSTYGQTLLFNEFTKCYTSNGNRFLMNKGFVLPDTINTFIHSAHNEVIEIKYTETTEGAKSTVVNYYLPNENSFENFSDQLKKSKFKYNKLNKTFENKTSSYSWQSFRLAGIVSYNNRKYNLISYLDYMGKELSVPKFELSPDELKKN